MPTTITGNGAWAGSASCPSDGEAVTGLSIQTPVQAAMNASSYLYNLIGPSGSGTARAIPTQVVSGGTWTALASRTGPTEGDLVLCVDASPAAGTWGVFRFCSGDSTSNAPFSVASTAATGSWKLVGPGTKLIGNGAGAYGQGLATLQALTGRLAQLPANAVVGEGGFGPGGMNVSTSTATTVALVTLSSLSVGDVVHIRASITSTGGTALTTGDVVKLQIQENGGSWIDQIAFPDGTYTTTWNGVPAASLFTRRVVVSAGAFAVRVSLTSSGSRAISYSGLVTAYRP